MSEREAPDVAPSFMMPRVLVADDDAGRHFLARGLRGSGRELVQGFRSAKRGRPLPTPAW